MRSSHRFLAAVFFCAWQIAAQAPSEINLSHDLIRLGIAPRNMTPNVTGADSRPLFQAALEYARAHQVKRLVADRGAYYFLTPQLPDRYLVVANFEDLTVDLRGSDLYFARSQRAAIHIRNCTRCLFENFTVDFLQLPFTQLEVKQVEAHERQIRVETMPGFDPPSAFNAVRNTLGTAEPLYIFVFRDGRPIPWSMRWEVDRPLADDRLSGIHIDLRKADKPPFDLAAIRPGDVLVLTARAGHPAVLAVSCDSLTLRRIGVYASGSAGVTMHDARNGLAEFVSVRPRPGTNRLISSNADGISLQQARDGNAVRGCHIFRTLDDGISANSLALGFVKRQLAPDKAILRGVARDPIPAGTPVLFLDSATVEQIGHAKVVSRRPLPGGEWEVTFDRKLPPLQPDFPMVHEDPRFRGLGMKIESNWLEDASFWTRGITLWGLTGVTVRGNLVRNIGRAGIAGIERTATVDWVNGPNDDIEIRSNVVENANQAFGLVAPDAVAAIQLMSLDRRFQFVSGRLNRDIGIDGNSILQTPRSAVWVENVNGGKVQDNLLLRAATHPESDNQGLAMIPAVVEEFRLPVVVRASDGVEVADNTVDNATPIVTVRPAAGQGDSGLRPGAPAVLEGAFPGKSAALAVSLKDSLAVTRKATVVHVLGSRIDFTVPPDTAPGAAIVSVHSDGHLVGIGAAFVDPGDGNTP